VTKKEIVKTISEKIGMTQLKTKQIVQQTFEAIVTALVEEGRIELRNFGVFEVKRRAARRARNPRTGQRVDVPQKFVVTFKPGKRMEEEVRELEAREARKSLELNQRTAARSSAAATPDQTAAPRTIVEPQPASASAVESFSSPGFESQADKPATPLDCK
jgi:integration host factor subunit beta